jgi:hypothetical protein
MTIFRLQPTPGVVDTITVKIDGWEVTVERSNVRGALGLIYRWRFSARGPSPELGVEMGLAPTEKLAWKAVRDAIARPPQ